MGLLVLPDAARFLLMYIAAVGFSAVEAIVIKLVELGTLATYDVESDKNEGEIVALETIKEDNVD